MKKPKRKNVLKRVIAILLSVIIGFTVLSMAGSVVIFKILYGRNELAGELEVSYSMIDSARYPRRQLEITSGGVKLNSFVYGESDSDAEALVIIAPGTNDSSEAHLAEMMFFVDNGCRVLAYDATGVKDSGGDGTVGLQQSKLDLRAVIAYANENIGLPIVLYGHSLGGYAAAVCAGEKNVKGVISLSGFNSPVETMHCLAKRYIGIVADIEYPFLYLQNYFVFGENADPKAVDVINSVETPVLICHGSRDTVIEYDLSIYSHKDEISNPNVVCVSITDEKRSLHSGMWLEGESAAYLREKKLEYKEVSRTMTEGELKRFGESFDAEKATRLDDSFMMMLLEFWKYALAQ